MAGIARLAAARAALGCALAACAFVAPANGQALQRLHVRSFTLSADRYDPHVGEDVRLRMAVHVDEKIGELDNVVLPDLSGFDVDGDERQCAPARRGGTDCSETLDVAARDTGSHVLGPVTLDAVNARNGKPSRFATNTITLQVSGDPQAPLRAAGQIARAFVQALLTMLALALVVGVLVVIVYRLVRRSQRLAALGPRISPPVAAVAPPPPESDPWRRWRELVAALDAERTRAAVVAVRNELRARVGAGPKETFGDLLARRAWGEDRRLLDAMLAIERAAFIEDARLGAAVDEALPVLRAVAPAPEDAATTALPQAAGAGTPR